MLSQGHSQLEISKVLHVNKSVISRDTAHLRKRAQDDLKNHIQDKLPEIYQECSSQISQLLTMCWSINRKEIDDRTKLQTLALINDINKVKIDLATNGVYITDALKAVESKVDHLKRNWQSQQQQRQQQSQPTEEDNEPTTTKITNRVF
jgi:hypothetical protein